MADRDTGLVIHALEIDQAGIDPGRIAIADGVAGSRGPDRDDRHRPHHLVVLMLNQVAVPDEADAEDRIDGEIVDADRSPARGQLGRPAHADPGHLPGWRADGVLPATFLWERLLLHSDEIPLDR